MPYVPPARARCLDAGAHMLAPGDLAYRLSAEIAEYLGGERELNFQRIAEVRGAVAAALNEFERRVAEPYEEGKRYNGADPYFNLSDDASAAKQAEVNEFVRRYDEERKAAPLCPTCGSDDPRKRGAKHPEQWSADESTDRNCDDSFHDG